MAQPYDDPFDESPDPSRRISLVTRRDIFDYIRTDGGPWWGRMDEIAFLGRLYDLEALPSTDARFSTSSRDIFQHRVNNYDWDDDWIFYDSRFQLASGRDEVLLGFLAQMLDLIEDTIPAAPENRSYGIVRREVRITHGQIPQTGRANDSSDRWTSQAGISRC